MQRLFRKDTILLLVILVLVVSVRFYKFSAPIADWHSWRQVDTSSVSRNFVENGFDVLHPRFYDLSNVPSGKDNPEGYRFVEFPLFNITQAGLFQVFHLFTLEQWGRLITIISSVLSTTFLYLILKNHADRYAAILAAFFYAIIPFNIFYGRTVLPDPSMTAAILGGIYFFDQWLLSLRNSNKKQSLRIWVFFIVSIIFTSEALLFKPYALFFTLPMFILAWRAFGLRMLSQWQLWVFFICALTPLVLWRLWMLQFPEGVPLSEWLFNKDNIRFKGAFFYWLFAERVGRLILGYWGLAIFVIGLLAGTSPQYKDKSRLFLYSFLVSSLLYMTVIAQGNVQHDYYQILIVPSLSIFLGLGAHFLLFPPKAYIHTRFSRGVFFLCTAFMIGFGWFFVKDFFNINNQNIITAGKEIDQTIPKDAKLIALYNGDTTFLYHTKRSGWASFQEPIPQLVKKGAQYMAILNPTETDLALGDTYKIVTQKQEYVLFDITQNP